jgi:hypothetical protein
VSDVSRQCRGLIFKGQNVHKKFDILALEHEATTLPPIIGHQSSSDTTPHPRIMKTSTAPLQKPIKLASVLMYSIK